MTHMFVLPAMEKNTAYPKKRMRYFESSDGFSRGSTPSNIIKENTTQVV